MKNVLYVSVLALAMTGCASTSVTGSSAAAGLSDDERKKAQQDDRGHRAMAMTEKRLQGLLEDYNADGDDTVTWAEYNNWRKARFDETDADGNGSVNAEEYVYEFENRLDERYEKGRQAHVEQTKRRFEALDKNEDGSIEWSEHLASGERIFTRWDKNDDGVIDDTDNTDEKKYGNDWGSNNNPISFVRMPTSHNFAGLKEIYDANKDGAVEKDELINERRSVFYLTDTDKNGVLSEDEYLAEFEDRVDQKINSSRRAQIKQTYVRFGILDDNKDQSMTFDEFQISGKRIFTRWDKNGDGIISAADVQG
ncbi:MAG: hypothetical protein CSH37_06345 [Thalassolituus sp.]|nr:MAG: hypothetical protein CSH37_06345 [Thalassolituus sp.]|tara:strand:- start:3291 stop:4217 length:927 start_codon:yes stop_codon:yes gene_type:complete